MTHEKATQDDRQPSRMAARAQGSYDLIKKAADGCMTFRRPSRPPTFHPIQTEISLATPGVP